MQIRNGDRARRSLAGGRSLHGDSRPCRANVLAEALVATLIASILAAAMVSQYAQVRRVNTGGQTQLMATVIAQEIIDELRSESWVLVSSNSGVHYPTVNGTVPNPPDVLFPRPLLQDGNLVYASGPTDVKYQAVTNVLHADATATGGAANQAYVNITQGPYTNSLAVSVRIDWKDSSGSHTYRTSTLLSQNGVNN